MATECTLIRCAVRVASRAARLPAIATLDWCELAADVLSSLCPGSVAGVLLGRIGSDGSVWGFEAAGVARHPDRPGDPNEHDPRPEIRWRLEQASTLGWTPSRFDVADRLSGGRLAEMLGASWKDTPGASMAAGFAACDILVGVVELAGEFEHRSLATFVAIPEGATVPPGLTDVFLAVLEHIGQAASLAIGSQAPGRSMWITPKEKEVLDRLILGYSVREIAAELGRSPHTMHDHVKSLHRKLGAVSRGDLIARALGHHRSDGERATASPPSTFELAEIRPRPAKDARMIYRAGA